MNIKHSPLTKILFICLIICCFVTIIKPTSVIAISKLKISWIEQENNYISSNNNPPLPKAITAPNWAKNSVKLRYTNTQKAPMISLIIDDMGVSKKWSDKAEDLPAPMTLSYLPYAENLPERTKRAKNMGHELMVHMPMEASRNTVDHGPRPLLTNYTSKTLQNNLIHNLSQFEGFIGINNHMGSKMSQDQSALSLIMRELKKRELLYIDSRTTALSIAEDVAKQYNVPTTRRDIFLDHEDSKEFIMNSLQKLERKALKNGTAIAIGHPKQTTIEILEKWIPDAKSRGFQIVPVSEIVKQRLYDKSNPTQLVSKK